MNTFLSGIILGAVGGVVAGIVMGLVIKGKRAVNGTSAKAKNLEKVQALFETSERVTNDDVQNALAVSDATAERYLDELEKQGLIKQVGTEGKYVYYTKA